MSRLSRAGGQRLIQAAPGGLLWARTRLLLADTRSSRQDPQTRFERQRSRAVEQAIRDQYHPGILHAACDRFALAPAAARPLDGFESFVYECPRADGDDVILRITHRLHRSVAQLEAEVDFIDHLASHGVTACAALPSRAGRKVERLDDKNGAFSAVAFEKAAGAPAGPGTWGPALWTAMGRMMGRMHALAGSYRPSVAGRRLHWHAEVGAAAAHVPAGQPAVAARVVELEATLSTFATGSAVYGLIHSDFHRGNFFVEDGHIHLFDFDDCQYSWYADDIAIALFYALPHDCSAAADRAYARQFLEHFMAGYREQNTLDPAWLEHIPLFLRRREIELYAVILRSFGPDGLDDWSASFMRGRREKIERAAPYVEIDFAAL